MTDEKRQQIEAAIREDEARSASLLELIQKANRERERIDEDYHREDMEHPDSQEAHELWARHRKCVDDVSRYGDELNVVWTRILNHEIDLYDKDYDKIMHDLKEGVDNYTKADFRAFIAPFVGDGTVKRNYEFFFSSLVSAVVIQLSALQRDHFPLDEAFRIIDAKASDPKEGYKKPKHIPKDLYNEFQEDPKSEGFLDPSFLENGGDLPVMELEEENVAPIRPDHYTPCGSVSELLFTATTAGRDVLKYGSLMNKISHKGTCKTFTGRGQAAMIRRTFPASNGRPEYVVEVSSSILQSLTPGDANLHKITTRILDEVSQQCFIDGKLTSDTVVIPFQKFVEDGQYKDIDTARAGCRRVRKTLVSWIIDGTIPGGKDGTVPISDTGVLFSHVKIREGALRVTLNTEFNWKAIMEYQTVLPVEYYAARDIAAPLIRQIFVQFRRQATKTADPSTVTLSMRLVQSVLGLRDPDQDAVPNPKREKLRVRRAVDAINEQFTKPREKAGGPPPAPDLFVECIADDALTYRKWLDTGKVVAHLGGIYLAPFLEIRGKKAARIEDAKARKRRKAAAKKPRPEKQK